MEQRPSALARVIGFFLENRLIVALLTVAVVAWGVLVAPFDWDIAGVRRDPVPVDAIPDTGENQQIVFTAWPGRSPQDVEDQVTYPLTVSLLGVPGVKSVRSNSMMGVSSIFVVFEDDVEFYWSRSRILEKLASLPANSLPDGVQPTLGPDATPLGQVFWYTLEGRDDDGRPAPGWGLEELRSIQDWYVRYALSSVEGVAEVASIGGHVIEYQIDVDPFAMRAAGVTLSEVFNAVRASNVDVGARTIEVNRAEYVVRGLGFLEGLDDIEQTVVRVRENVPITIGDIAEVNTGPALRRGALDKGGAEAVGGVVVARYGANPMAVIERVKAKIAEIEPGLPAKVLDDGRTSRVHLVPFYDRSGLIQETLGTLGAALEQEILVTVVVVLVMLGHLGSAVLVSALLPLAVLMCFIAMRYFGVTANIVALSGIAIAIGTMVDVGIVLTENIVENARGTRPGRERREAVRVGATEVGGAVVTAVLTTVIGFLPVFAMQGAEGKLFQPLAYTKTFALVASIIVALAIIPAAALTLLGGGSRREGEEAGSGGGSGDGPGEGELQDQRGGARRSRRRALLRAAVLVVAGAVTASVARWWMGAPLVVLGLWHAVAWRLSERTREAAERTFGLILALAVAIALALIWQPLGVGRSTANIVFALVAIGGVLLSFRGLIFVYEPVLRWCLRHKVLFLSAPLLIALFGLLSWLGFGALASPLRGPAAAIANASRAVLPASLVGEGEVSVSDVSAWGPYASMEETFPGLGKEFMPPLDEGSYLLMPVTMPHASIGEALELMQLQDMAIRAIPEVDDVVGKIGRVDSALDPAPVSMIETIITYVPEFKSGADGRTLRFRRDAATGEFARDGSGALIPDDDGAPFRQWRDHIHAPVDIWSEIESAAAVPGVTTASMLQPIETRRIMLQTGMRANMGVKISGPDLETLEDVALDFEEALEGVASIRPATVLADRVIGKPYVEIDIDRRAIARHGMSIRGVQDVIEVAIGGRALTSIVDGRERYPVRVRYQRELRDDIGELGDILVPGANGMQIPLGQLADIRYTPGPQVIKSEDTFLTAYVLFEGRPGRAEVDVVEDARAHLRHLIDGGALALPPGVSYRFAGAYENQQRAAQTLRVVLPLALLLIFIVLYLQFRSTLTTGIVFSSVFVAWSGGFILLWLYGQPWFLAGEPLGVDLRGLFQVGTLNLSVAVWVGFLALFGIATDDGVLMATYLDQSFERERPRDRAAIHDAVVTAGLRRIRPCLMTTATTLLALLPILTSTGRGSDVMVPMAVPSVGGMIVAIVTIFVVPVLYATVAEARARAGR